MTNMILCFAIAKDMTRKFQLSQALHTRLEWAVENCVFYEEDFETTEIKDGKVIMTQDKRLAWSPCPATPESSVLVLNMYNEQSTPNVFQKYLVTEMQSVWRLDEHMAFRFRRPNHQVLALAVDKHAVNNFLLELRWMCQRLSLHLNLDDGFNPMFHEHMCVMEPVPEIMHLFLLNRIILENVKLYKFTVGPGPLVLLSLNNSTLGETECEKQNFFDWMTSPVTTEHLKVLLMNNCQLGTLPREIMYLKMLRTLSVVNNNLRKLPDYLGRLKLDSLYINNNQIRYMPGTLVDTIFDALNFKYNCFYPYTGEDDLEKRRAVREKGKRNVPSMFNIAFSSVYENWTLKRSEIPQLYLPLFDSFHRCSVCSRLMPSEEITRYFIWSYVNTVYLFRNKNVPWSFYECKYKCGPVVNITDLNLRFDDKPTTTLGERLRLISDRNSRIINYVENLTE